jgi:hypothetical protein
MKVGRSGGRHFPFGGFHPRAEGSTPVPTTLGSEPTCSVTGSSTRRSGRDGCRLPRLQPAPERNVALKLIVQVVGDVRFRERFLAETDWRRRSSANVVRSTMPAGGRPALHRHAVRGGGELKSLLHGRADRPARALAIWGQVAAALDAAHARAPCTGTSSRRTCCSTTKNVYRRLRAQRAPRRPGCRRARSLRRHARRRASRWGRRRRRPRRRVLTRLRPLRMPDRASALAARLGRAASLGHLPGASAPAERARFGAARPIDAVVATAMAKGPIGGTPPAPSRQAAREHSESSRPVRESSPGTKSRSRQPRSWSRSQRWPPGSRSRSPAGAPSLDRASCQGRTLSFASTRRRTRSPV